MEDFTDSETTWVWFFALMPLLAMGFVFLIGMIPGATSHATRSAMHATQSPCVTGVQSPSL